MYVFCVFSQESGLYAYKIFGTMDVPADICAKVYVDSNYRKIWDPYVRGMLLRQFRLANRLLLSDIIVSGNSKRCYTTIIVIRAVLGVTWYILLHSISVCLQGCHH